MSLKALLEMEVFEHKTRAPAWMGSRHQRCCAFGMSDRAEMVALEIGLHGPTTCIDWC